MIGPTDLLHPSPAPHIKIFQIFLICCPKRPSFSTIQSRREIPKWIPPLQAENFCQTFCDRPLVAPPVETRHFPPSQVSRRGLTPRQNHHHFDANKKKKTHFVLMWKDRGVWGGGFGGKKRSCCCGGFCRVFNASLVLPPPTPNLPFSLHTQKVFNLLCPMFWQIAAEISPFFLLTLFT